MGLDRTLLYLSGATRLIFILNQQDMANKINLNKSAAAVNTGFNNVILGRSAKEEIHVFEEKPRTGEAGNRKDAHELFSLFTADIIKKKTIFAR